MPTTLDIKHLRKKYLQEPLLKDEVFLKSIAKEEVKLNKWTIHRSYTAANEDIDEFFVITVPNRRQISSHITCALTIVKSSAHSPTIDSREAIFKARQWVGPEIIVCPRSAGHPASPVPDTDGPLVYSIFNVTNAFIRGITAAASGRNKSVDQVFEVIRPNGGDDSQSPDNATSYWETLTAWKKKGVPAERLFAKSLESAHKGVKQRVAKGYVSAIMTGLCHQYYFGGDDPLKGSSKHASAYYYGRGVRRLVDVVSVLCHYYGPPAIAAFTFWTIRRPSLTRIGHLSSASAVFFRNAVVALIDIAWRRLYVALGQSKRATIPMLNPVALLPWYTESITYESVYNKLGLEGFADAFPERVSEVSIHDITLTACRRLQNVTEQDDRSKRFIVDNIDQLARNVTSDDLDELLDNPESHDTILARSLLEGKAFPQGHVSVSTEALYKIIDVILPNLNSNLKTLKNSQPPQPTKQKQHESQSNAQHGDSPSEGHSEGHSEAHPVPTYTDILDIFDDLPGNSETFTYD